MPQCAALVILVAAPSLFALTTWQPQYSSNAFRYYSTPVLLAELVLIVALLAGGMSFFGNLRELRLPQRLGAAGLVISAASSTVLIAPLQEVARIHFMISLVHMGFALLLVGALRGSWFPIVRLIPMALAVGVALQVLVSWGLALSVRADPDFNWLRFGAGVTHVRQLGFSGLALTGLAAGLYATSQSRPARATWLALLMLGFTWTFLSGGRAAIVAGIVGLTAILILMPPGKILRVAVAYGTAFVIGAGLSILAMMPLPHMPRDHWGLHLAWMKLLGHSPVDDYTSRRMEIWQETVRAITQSPLIGHGEGQFRSQIAAAQSKINHPHNSVLQFLYQWGIIGTLSLAALAGPPILSGLRSARSAPAVVLPAIGPVVGLGTMSLLEGALYHPFPIIIVIICLALLASVRRAPACSM